jgi:regulator of nonsense transcripts 3
MLGQADPSYGVHPQHSRAYVLMNDVESLVAFHAGFDGHIFRAKTGELEAMRRS